MSYKQVILVRMDLKMPKGKLAVQCSHASVDAALASSTNKLAAWRKEGMKKVALKVKDLEELELYARKTRAAGILTRVITDAGKTFFDQPTVTCAGLGPEEEELLDKITGKLSML